MVKKLKLYLRLWLASYCFEHDRFPSLTTRGMRCRQCFDNYNRQQESEHAEYMRLLHKKQADLVDIAEEWRSL